MTEWINYTELTDNSESNEQIIKPESNGELE